ncbi:MAG TPA: thioredoxin family protein [Macromonas sp.]|nr:thioredoxin family protein [Macromonas sp.]
MTALAPYGPEAPSRADVDAMPGLTLLDFGVNWCGHCQAAQPAIAAALAGQADLRHLRLEDGKGRPLGRSYSVKLWPTLILLRNGQEVARLVRPTDAVQVSQLLEQA